MLIGSDGTVDLVHLLVRELILADNEPAQKEQDRRDDGDEPKDTLFGQERLFGKGCIEAYPSQDEARNECILR